MSPPSPSPVAYVPLAEDLVPAVETGSLDVGEPKGIAW